MNKQEIKTNIDRLEKIISITNTWQKLYIDNMKQVIESYKKLIISLEIAEREEQEEDFYDDIRDGSLQECIPIEWKEQP